MLILFSMGSFKILHVFGRLQPSRYHNSLHSLLSSYIELSTTPSGPSLKEYLHNDHIPHLREKAWLRGSLVSELPRYQFTSKTTYPFKLSTLFLSKAGIDCPGMMLGGQRARTIYQRLGCGCERSTGKGVVLRPTVGKVDAQLNRSSNKCTPGK
jgi:hypothetical protein